MNSQARRGAIPQLVGESVRYAGVLVGVAERLPVAGGLIGSARARIATITDAAVTVAVSTTRAVLGVVIREVVDALVEEVDLTDLVLTHVDLKRLISEVLALIDIDEVITTVDLDRAVAQVDLNAAIDLVDLDAVIGKVDLDAVATGIDIDAIAARIDIDAILGRVDLIGLAEEIIDGVDLPDIIREASTSVTADVMTDVRSTSERADDAVANAVNRFLRRRGAAAVEAAPDAEGPR
ncbi:MULTISPECIES: hypothetical protein [Gordonia]|uniref:hypothetical protein n=1 Tax=unclassified Gordonia (in: high G+C Gram-positive bacteria) TaxID=2657482 RepID=UPI001EF5EA80|nr:hypothetical protein [Gordonia sp. McavH-238-E]MCG7634247.1 hypothetical protein [Gordonia sp. McavH-238-E]